jgi:putative spermidine/putrescine transport system permease protein
MPFWTSLLVRIVAWMIMLQQNGVVNDTLVGILPCFEGMVNYHFLEKQTLISALVMKIESL